MTRHPRFALSFALLVLTPFVTTLSAQDIVEKMEREHAGDRPISNPLSDTSPEIPVEGAAVSYAELDGYPTGHSKIFLRKRLGDRDASQDTEERR